MIGQEQLLKKIDSLMEHYPKFSIITGPKGSGKKTISKYICRKLNIPIMSFGTGIDEVRNAIDMAYEQYDPICYMFPDADGMSLGAKNALLKITEEPPKNAYFILTLQSMSNTLETIKSRGTVFPLDTYTKDELISYRKYKQYSETFDDVLRIVCSNTGEVDELFSCDIAAFYKFAHTIANSIHIPKSGNIFKISKQIKSKQDDNGFDGILLFKAVRNLFLEKAKETKKPQYLYASTVTSECLRDLQLGAVNKIGTVDMWIMNVRTVLRGID